MFKMVDGTGIIGEDLICPLGVSTPQPPNYDKVEVEGTGMLVLPNSLDAPLERLELGGKTEQVQTTGAQLLDEKLLLDLDSPNYDKTTSGSGVIYYRLPVNGTVTVSVKNNKNAEYLKVTVESDKSGGVWLSHNTASTSKTATLVPKDGNIYLGVNNNLKGIKAMLEKTGGVMINAGSITTAYEPYTGGKSSPSAEYPQEIVNTGKWNEEKQKYEVAVKITGKNRFNREKAKDVLNWIHIEGDGYLKFPIRVKNGSMITFSYTEKLTEGEKFYLGIAKKNTGSVIAWLYHDTNLSISNSKYTITSEGDYVYLMCNCTAIQVFLDVIKTLQVEISPTQTDYQLYKKQTLTLTSDRPITKWDKLIEQGGEIGWLYGTEKYIVTGRETFSTNKSYALEESVDFRFINSNQAGIRNAADNFCNKLTFVDSVWSKHDIGFGISGSEVHIRLPLEMIGATKTEESNVIKTKFTEYLSKKCSDGDPFTFWHKSKTTEFVPLPQSEQNAIRALKTYYPTTVITADGGELDPDIKAIYRKEI